MRTRVTLALVLGFVTLSVLTSCTKTTAQLPDAATQAQAEAYLRTNIGDLSSATTSSATYRVTGITWEDPETAVVTFGDDAHVLRGRAHVSLRTDGSVVVDPFILIDDQGNEISSWAVSSAAMSASSDSSAMMDALSSAMSTSSSVSSISNSSVSNSSASSMAGSSRSAGALGAFCGGIAAFPCADDLKCQLDGSYPDAGGKCVEK